MAESTQEASGLSTTNTTSTNPNGLAIPKLDIKGRIPEYVETPRASSEDSGIAFQPENEDDSSPGKLSSPRREYLKSHR